MHRRSLARRSALIAAAGAVALAACNPSGGALEHSVATGLRRTVVAYSVSNSSPWNVTVTNLSAATCTGVPVKVRSGHPVNNGLHGTSCTVKGTATYNGVTTTKTYRYCILSMYQGSTAYVAPSVEPSYRPFPSRYTKQGSTWVHSGTMQWAGLPGESVGKTFTCA